MFESIGARVIGPILDLVKGRQERKKAIADTEAKIRVASQQADAELTLKRHEVEALAVQGLQHTWKDEYALIVTTSPYVLIIIGSLLAAFGAPQVLDGVSIAIQTLEASDVPVGVMMQAAVYTSLGIYVFKRNF